jgi:hypothetical protein
MIAETPMKIGEPVLRWSARARSIAEIETELARIWSTPDLTTRIEGEDARHVAARTSVMNLVVCARRPELAERSAATIQSLTGRHPSRTIVIQSADPDGPSWLDARIDAHCILPREDAPETCAGRHSRLGPHRTCCRRPIASSSMGRPGTAMDWPS